MKTAPDDIRPHPDFQSNPDMPPGGPDIPPPPAAPEIRPDPGHLGVTPDPQPELEPSLPDGDRIDQPATAPEIEPNEPAGDSAS